MANPSYVPDLPSKAVHAIKSTDEMLVIDPNDKELYTTKMSKFRGAGNFVMNEVPGLTPPSSLGLEEWINGDAVYYNGPEGIVLYTYDVSVPKWNEEADITGSKIHTEASLGVAGLDQNKDAVWKNDNVRKGDFYVNATRNIMYGPYTIDDGFNFETTIPGRFVHLRTTRRYEATGVTAPVVTPSTNRVVAYAPTWGHTAIGGAGSLFRSIDSDVDTVLLAFAYPDLPPFNSANPMADYGFDFGPASTFEQLRDDISFMKTEGRKVLISVGGATYSSRLGALEAEGHGILTNGEAWATPTNCPHIHALVDMMDYLGADGLDVDWEDLAVTQDSSMFYRLYTYTKALNKAVELSTNASAILAIASFSTSWDQTSITRGNATGIQNPTNTDSWWAGMAGQARGAARFTHNGTAYSNWLDMLSEIYIMSYDVGDTGDDRYSAITAYDECVYVLTEMGKSTIPVCVGIEPGDEAGGSTAKIVVKTAHATGEESIVRKNQYGAQVDHPHAVEYYGDFIKGQAGRANDGVMIWSLWKAAASTPTNADGHSYATANTAISELGSILKVDKTIQGGYDTPVDYYPNGLDANSDIFMPANGDEFWVKKPKGNGHGGFIWTFDSNIYRLSTETTHLDKLKEAWANKSHQRQPTLIVGNVPPVQDDDSYRGGDAIIDSSNSVIYVGYKESISATSDLDVLFDDKKSMTGSKIHYSDVAPVQDDAKYVSGDYLMVDDMGTQRLLGPYKFGAVDAFAAWPLFSIMRGSVVHEVTAIGDMPPADWPSGQLFAIHNGVYIVEGDQWCRNLGAGRKIIHSAGVKVDRTARTMDWGSEITYGRPSKFWNQVSATYPAIDDGTYFENDYIITGENFIYGPYRMEQAAKEDAWPLFSKITTEKTVYINTSDTTLVTPPTDNRNVAWGGAGVVKNDKCRISYNDSITGKYRMFMATAVDVGDESITWTELLEPPKTHTSVLNGVPTKSDKDAKGGDFIISAEGIKYGPYKEQAVDKYDAWPFSGVIRGPRTRTVPDATWPLVLPVTVEGDDGTTVVTGDIFRFVSATGKIKEYTVTSAEVGKLGGLITLSSGVNPRGSQTFTVTDVARPPRNDDTYSDGDYAVNANMLRYGPYSEGESTDEAAWPYIGDLKGNNTYTDPVDGQVYEYSVNDGRVYLVPKI